MKNRGHNLRFALLASLLSIAAAPGAIAATAEVQVPFDTIPTAVQNTLTRYAIGLSDVARASAWRGTLNGQVVYTGRVTDFDGTTRIIDADSHGRLIQVRQVPRTRPITPPY